MNENNKEYDYEVTDNGYFIFVNGKKKLYQDEPNHIPYPNLTYEENAQIQIEEMKQKDEEMKKDKTKMQELEEQVTDIQLALAEIVEGGIANG